jgi:hypothetical protein
MEGMAEIRNANKILTSKPEGKRSFGRNSLRLKASVS